MSLRDINAMHVIKLVFEAGQGESAVAISKKDLRLARVVVREDEVVDTVAIEVCDAGAAKLESLGLASNETGLFGDVDEARPELTMNCREARCKEKD